MNLFLKVAFAIFGIAAFSSCQQTTPTPFPGDVDSMEELEAPASFTYSLWKTTDLKLVVDGPSKFGRVQVQVFGDHNGEHELLYQGMQAIHDTNEVHFKHGSHYTSFSVKANFSDGASATGTCRTDATLLSLQRLVQETPMDFTSSFKTSSSDCSSCATVVSAATSALTVAANDTLCLDGSTGASITVGKGGHLNLCGTHTSMGNVDLGEDATLSLSASAAMTFANGSGLSLGKNSKVVLYENSNFNSSGTLLCTVRSELISYGTMRVDGHLDVTDSASFTSFGNCTVKGHIEVSGAHSTLTNYGSLSTVVNDHIRVKDQGKLVNHCHLHSDQHIWIEDLAQLINYNQMDCDHKLKMKDGGVLELKPSSISISQDLQLYDAQIVNYGVSTAVLKIWDDALYYKDATIGGLIDVCVKGLNQNTRNLTMSGNAQFSCSSSIPPSACITIGHDPGFDDDNDGVTNALDPFPQDSSRAIKVCEVASTLVFEDNWPYKGDFDFNDLVMSYQIWGIANRNSKIKDIYFAYKMRARGAAYENGFGIEFNTAPNNLISPDYEPSNTLTTSALVLGDVSTVLSAWNTDSTQQQNFVDVAWDTVVFTFNKPINDSVLGTFNPFLIIDKERGREVHLADHKPTSLADATLMGTGDDRSNEASRDYYQTDQNQPWALQLPVIFDYPFERVDITKAYLNFDNWAASAGTTNEDWYDSTKPGNAKGRKIHKRNK
jgi:LruC domain-containing protein